MSTLPLSKRTKTELLEEYNKLLNQHEELRRTAQLVSDPQSVALISKVDGYTVDQLTNSINELKTSVNATLGELTDKLIVEAQKFGEIQKAIELAKKNLELHYHVQVAADTLDRMIQEHKAQSLALDDEMTTKRRDWGRAQEEHEYNERVRSHRTDEAFEEAKTRQDRTLKDREEALKRQEQELVQLRGQVQGFSGQLDKALSAREQEAMKRARLEFDVQLESARKDWKAQESLLKMQIDNFEERLKTQQVENLALRGEVEKSNKRVQELVVKIVEGGSRMVQNVENPKEAKPSITASV